MGTIKIFSTTTDDEFSPAMKAGHGMCPQKLKLYSHESLNYKIQ
jgi:hypothetical protein